MSKISIKRDEGHYGVNLRVYIKGQFGMNVDVYKKKDVITDEYQKAVVNWGSIGSQEPKKAQDYARLLQVASHEAEKLDSEVK